MGSKVEPYFIVTPEKLQRANEYVNIHSDKTPPITPAPSGAYSSLYDDDFLNKNGKRKTRFVKYKIPVKDVRKKLPITRKMELIKQKLEKSRERFNSQKIADKNPDLKCEPGYLGSQDSPDVPYKMDRSVSDMANAQSNKDKADGTVPYVYFVVSEDKIGESFDGVTLATGEKVKSKSADKRRRVRIVEENRNKLKEKRGKEKIQGIAREIGLKCDVDTKQDSRPPTRQPSVNLITFPGTSYEETSHKRRPNVHVIHSPPNIPPCTPATTLVYSDPDENIPIKPFLSKPLYAGKSKLDTQTSSPMFGLPEIPADQKRKALGMGTRFEDFAYNTKPQSSQNRRKVTFAASLPVIKGSGFVLENRNDMDSDVPTLGPRAVTMGSITLPSERMDKQSLCQKYLLGENLSSGKTTRRNGVPLPLPKIDIVSNVYDEMIIKMIREYLQDSNTPTRQSQLAKDLLVHLQKHSDTMKELNVPNLNKIKNRPEFMKQTSLKLQSMLRVPPNTAEGSAYKSLGLTKEMYEELNNKAKEMNESNANTEIEDRHNLITTETSDIKMETVPFVQITFKNKDGNAPNILPSTDQLPDMPDEEMVPLKSSDGARDLHTSQNGKRSRQILTPVAPVSFQMAPPGLSKEDTNLSIQLNA